MFEKGHRNGNPKEVVLIVPHAAVLEARADGNIEGLRLAPSNKSHVARETCIGSLSVPLGELVWLALAKLAASICVVLI